MIYERYQMSVKYDALSDSDTNSLYSDIGEPHDEVWYDVTTIKALLMQRVAAFNRARAVGSDEDPQEPPSHSDDDDDDTEQASSWSDHTHDDPRDFLGGEPSEDRVGVWTKSLRTSRIAWSSEIRIASRNPNTARSRDPPLESDDLQSASDDPATGLIDDADNFFDDALSMVIDVDDPVMEETHDDSLRPGLERARSMVVTGPRKAADDMHSDEVTRKDMKGPGKLRRAFTRMSRRLSRGPTKLGIDL
ncbi:unnamed protein product [Mycena citricolor]|uniref:Uncharacterized protein n=1 Tax=Mycena citricolor TaxID=2018698 RepID=A0AAD2HD63_9AGAR|nr:unnamed protein product [Mycena citricolor]